MAGLTILSVIALMGVAMLPGTVVGDVSYYCTEKSTGKMDAWDVAAMIGGSNAILAVMVLTNPCGIGVAAGVAIVSYA